MRESSIDRTLDMANVRLASLNKPIEDQFEFVLQKPSLFQEEELVELGFDYVCDVEGCKVFRKRK